MSSDAVVPLVSPAKLRDNVVDIHTHIASLDYIPLPFIEGVAENVASSLRARGVSIPTKRIVDQCIGSMQDPDCRQLLSEMEEAGIAHSVLLIADFTFVFKDGPLTIAEISSRHRDLLRQHADRLSVFGGVDPRWGLDGVNLFELAVTEWGFCGFKIYPPCGYSPSDERLFPFYEICAQRSLPVLLHVGPTAPTLSFEFSSPMLLDRAARSFPQVNFILAHGALHHVEESLLMCEYRPNVYLDFSGIQSRLAIDQETAYYRHVFYRNLNHKILFGSDWPLFRLQGSQKDYVTQMLDEKGPLSGLSGDDLNLIFSANAKRLLPAGVASSRTIS